MTRAAEFVILLVFATAMGGIALAGAVITGLIANGDPWHVGVSYPTAMTFTIAFLQGRRELHR